MDLKVDIFNIVINNIKDPAFVISQDGIVLASNSSANDYIPGSNFSGEFAGLFRNGNAKIINDIFLESLRTDKSASKEFDIEFINGRAGRFKVVFTPVRVGPEKFGVVCSFNTAENYPGNQGKTKFSVSNKEISEIIKDEEILRIINEVKSSFPFTFLGKNKIQNEINRLDEAFWLKSKDGKYILVNQKFADLLSLKPALVTGKSEFEFIPGNLTEFYKSILKYIETTSNLVIRHGLPFPQHAVSGNIQIIEFPLCDLDNNVIAIIGLTQSAGKFSENNIISDQFAADALNSFSLPFLVIDQTGIVKYKTEKFAELMGLSELQPGYSYEMYLSEDVSREVAMFISDEHQRERKVKEHIIYKRNISFEINLRKIYNSNYQFNGCLIFIQEKIIDNEKNNTTISREKMYEIILQTSPEPMFIYDTENLRFLEANQAALDVYGYSRNEFLQMDLTDLYAPEDIQTLLDTSNSRNKEGVFTGPWRHKKRDGSSILVEISKTSFEYKKKNAHFNIVRDVTEKNQLLEELQLFKSAFQNTSDLLFVTDRDGFISHINEAVTRFFGLSKDDLLDRPFITLLSDQSRTEVNSGVFHAKLSDSVDFSILLKKGNDRIIKAGMTATPVRDYESQVISYSIIVKPEAEKAQFQHSLPAAQIPAVVEEEPKASGALDPAFLSSVFHEILTPMNVIIGFIQELTDSIESPSEEQKEAADIIDQNRKLLLQTMDSVLEYSHIEQNRISILPERVIFTEMLDLLQSNTKKLADVNNIEFSYGKISSSLSFETDRHRLESLLTMFISIAMRITKEKKIFLSAYQYDDKNFIISIKDSRAVISDYLLMNLKELFSVNESDIKRDFGASKLTIRLARKLLMLLSGRFEIVQKGDTPGEFGLIFPILFSKPEEPRPENAVFKQMIEHPEKPVSKGKVWKQEKVMSADKDSSSDKIDKVQPEKSHGSAVRTEFNEMVDDRDFISDPDLQTALKTDEPVKLFEERENNTEIPK
ncbi:MAG: PAS domain S-box protein, partial [Bacillota bacterium]